MKEVKNRCSFCKHPSAQKYHDACKIRANRRQKNMRAVNIPSDAIIKT